ncbi:fluoride efflux transporter CrcB [Saccharopolyspora gloriosae]|uniref:fluoride efflux transporter CrcB n=1 Tax=Saccharopolyspora gloriosae TaxID=455344 RepID=UPI001FB6C1F4|nr:fluoride efflux transporter CrcB [Saccharopolyspora gloriosae]
MANETADVRIPARRRGFAHSQSALLLVISLGGGLGAVSRYGILQWSPTAPGSFPWGTFTINVLGCLLIGVLMVLITEVWSVHPLVRPFLGIGVLGGFTTFSTYAVEFDALLRPGNVAVAAAYLVGTLVCALLAVLAGVAITRWAVSRKDS